MLSGTSAKRGEYTSIIEGVFYLHSFPYPSSTRWLSRILERSVSFFPAPNVWNKFACKMLAWSNSTQVKFMSLIASMIWLTISGTQASHIWFYLITTLTKLWGMTRHSEWWAVEQEQVMTRHPIFTTRNEIRLLSYKRKRLLSRTKGMKVRPNSLWSLGQRYYRLPPKLGLSQPSSLINEGSMQQHLRD